MPNKEEQQRSGGSGIYYHFQWINGATSAYPWLYTSPLALTWMEMKKAYDHNARELWIVNVGDIKPAELGIEHFMQMAWDINKFENNDPQKFLMEWAMREFGAEYAPSIAGVLTKHLELGYVRRPEHMVMYNGRKKELKWDWFSLYNYNDEAQKRIDDYDRLINKVDKVYGLLPDEKKDAFFQMVVYNVKGAALQNKKVLYAQKSNVYGKEKRASAATYAALAQQAENEIHELINHYNREQVAVGNKWDRMASLPGPWGAQWHQWDMPPLSNYSGVGNPNLKLSTEGDVSNQLPCFSVFNKNKRFIDLYNTGNGAVHWKANVSEEWIKLSETEGTIYDENRLWVTIDWEKAPKGIDTKTSIYFSWDSSMDDIWRIWENQSEADKVAYKNGTLSFNDWDSDLEVGLSLFNPMQPSLEKVKGFVESNGYISMEAEHFSRKNDKKHAGWNVIEGLGRSGNSITVLPVTIQSNSSIAKIIGESPVVEYDIYTFTEGEVNIEFNCIPSNPINADYALRIAVSIDDNDPIITSDAEDKNVIDNLMKITSKLDIGERGVHTLKVWMVDPGVTIDKIIINTGGVKESYLGPPESVYYGN